MPGQGCSGRPLPPAPRVSSVLRVLKSPHAPTVPPTPPVVLGHSWGRSDWGGKCLFPRTAQIWPQTTGKVSLITNRVSGQGCPSQVPAACLIYCAGLPAVYWCVHMGLGYMPPFIPASHTHLSPIGTWAEMLLRACPVRPYIHLPLTALGNHPKKIKQTLHSVCFCPRLPGLWVRFPQICN